jgi:hypothetical protein
MVMKAGTMMSHAFLHRGYGNGLQFARENQEKQQA